MTLSVAKLNAHLEDPVLLIAEQLFREEWPAPWRGHSIVSAGFLRVFATRPDGNTGALN